MGDSDDDGDYKRRDKFRTERRGYDSGMSMDSRGVSPGGGGGRREWRDARPGPPGGGSYGGHRRSGGYYDGGGGGGGGGRRGYDDGGRRHEMSPPSKRMRGNDWDEGGYGGGGGGGSYERGYDRSYEREHSGYRGGRPSGGGGYERSEHHRGGGGREGGAGGADGGSSEHSQPLMMSFKAFLATQDDTISDEDAIKKYADYKLEFKRQQLNEFFVSHKDEEWFKLKYHPEDATKRREEQRSALKRRIEVYQKFLDSGKLESVTVDQDQSDAMVKLLDSVVILLEGGSDFDLQQLPNLMYVPS